MIFYTIIETANDVVIDWATTQAEARQLTKHYRDTQSSTIDWEEHEVPTDKATLLAFLKANCVGKLIAVVKKVTTETSTPS
jgi:hypothetical protein